MEEIEILGNREQSAGAWARAPRGQSAARGEAGLRPQSGVGACGSQERHPSARGLEGAPPTAERFDAANLTRGPEENGPWKGPRVGASFAGVQSEREFLIGEYGAPGEGDQASLSETSVPFPSRFVESLLLRHRLLPTVRLSSVEDAVPLAEALQRAGLPLLLIELSTRAALPAIARVRHCLEDFAVGAGAVLSRAQIVDAMRAGAWFGAGPAMHPHLLEAARSEAFPFLPGAMTPSDIEIGIQSGFSCQCICPAAAMGGPPMVRALAEPYMHTSLLLVPTGGLRMADFQEYLMVSRVGGVAGGFICEQALVEAGMWEDVEAQALLCRRKAWAALRANDHALPEGDEPRAGPEEIYH